MIEQAWRAFYCEGAFAECEGERLKKNGDRRWHLWSRQGLVLLRIALNPDSTVQDIAASMSLTQRAVWDHIGDLRRAGMIDSHKDGRRNRYRVNLEGPFKHPTIRGVTLRTVFSNLLSATSREHAGAPAAR
jgi:DNA-binding transcriptional ArsR family regulator